MKKRGFTLIELLVTLAIISIVLSIGVIRFGVIDNIKANTEMQTMINDINYAKMKALSTDSDYCVVLSKNSYVVGPCTERSSKRMVCRNLEYVEIVTQNTNTIKYTASGSVSNAGTVEIKSKFGDQDRLNKLVVTVAGGHSRIE